MVLGNIFAQDSISKKFAQTINIETLKKHVYLLASDSLEGRETGKIGCEKASKYIESEFRKYGLIPPLKDQNDKRTFFQPFDYGTSKWKDVYAVNANGKKVKYENDIFAMTTNELFQDLHETKIHWVNVSLPNELEQFTFSKDEIVFLSKNKGEKYNEQKINFLLQKQVKGLVFVCDTKAYFEHEIKYSDDILNRIDAHILSKTQRKYNFPVWIISPKGAEILFEKENLQKEKEFSPEKKISLIAKKKEKIEWSANNVIGYIRGKEKPNEFIVVSAHYDHVGYNEMFYQDNGRKIHNGANDNASGTTGIMAIAEAFSKAMKQGIIPRRSIVFIAFAGEEKGLLGSKYYTDISPVFPIQNTVLNLNVDMIGRSYKRQQRTYICPVGLGFIYKDWVSLQEKINQNSVNIEIDYSSNKIDDRARLYYRSDHFNFGKYNIPVIFYHDKSSDDYHAPTDDAHKIEYTNMLERTKLIFHTAWEAGNMETLPQK